MCVTKHKPTGGVQMIMKHLVKNFPKKLLQWKALIWVGESMWYQHVFLSEIRLPFIYQWLCNPQKIQKCPLHKYDWKYETIWNEPHETISSVPFHHLLPPPGTDRCPSKHSSGLDDIRASNLFRYGRNAKPVSQVEGTNCSVLVWIHQAGCQGSSMEKEKEEN